MKLYLVGITKTSKGFDVAQDTIESADIPELNRLANKWAWDEPIRIDVAYERRVMFCYINQIEADAFHRGVELTLELDTVFLALKTTDVKTLLEMEFS